MFDGIHHDGAISARADWDGIARESHYMFQSRCSCGWVGSWLRAEYLAEADYDQHVAVSDA